MPAVGARRGTPASISASEEPHTVAIDDEPFELGDLRDHADRVRELVMQRQHRVDGAPRELAVTDLAPSGGAEPPRLAHRERREVVVQHEAFFVGAGQRVDELLVLAGAERRHHESLGLAAGEERRAVGARKDADLGHDRPHRLDVATIDALAGVEDVPAHDLGFKLLEDTGDPLLAVGRIFNALREEMRHHFGLGGVDSVVARHLVWDRIRFAQILLDEAEDLLLQGRGVGERQLARLLRGLFREANDGFDHRLEMPMAEHHGAEHHFFGQFLGFELDHQHRVLGAGDNEIEIALGHLVDLRVEHVFIVDESDARRTDRPHERCPGQREGGRGRDHRQNVGIVLLVMRHTGHDDLGIAAPAVGEQRSDRPVDEARGQRLAFGRATFAFEVAARNAAGGEKLFLIIAGERQEIDPDLRFLCGNYGRENRRLAVAREDRAVCLPRYLAGFENELAPAPIELLTMNGEHRFRLLSWFCGDESHEQDGEELRIPAVRAR